MIMRGPENLRGSSSDFVSIVSDTTKFVGVTDEDFRLNRISPQYGVSGCHKILTQVPKSCWLFISLLGEVL